MKRNNKIFAILLALLMAFGPAAAVPALAASNSKTPSHVYYFQNGVGTANYTGIVNINGVLYYVKDCKVATNVTGTVNVGGTKYTVKAGVVVGKK